MYLNSTKEAKTNMQVVISYMLPNCLREVNPQFFTMLWTLPGSSSPVAAD
jgi:hypothetical protein